jgi:hypothetical protein
VRSPVDLVLVFVFAHSITTQLLPESNLAPLAFEKTDHVREWARRLFFQWRDVVFEYFARLSWPPTRLMMGDTVAHIRQDDCQWVLLFAFIGIWRGFCYKLGYIVEAQLVVPDEKRETRNGANLDLL